MAGYKLDKIINQVIVDFEMEDSTVAKDALRHKIMEVCKRIQVEGGGTLWDATLRKEGSQKKGVHIFTEYQKQLLYCDPDFRQYAAKRSVNNDLLDAAEEAAQMNKEESKLTPETYREETMRSLLKDEDTSYITDRKFMQKKQALMVEALYSMFFEPLDEKKLYADINAVDAVVAVESGRRHTGISRLAEKRLKDFTNYCKRKKDVTQNPSA